MEEKDYYVVLQNNGRKTIACFENKKDFDDWYPSFRNVEKIVAQGITARKAIELSDCIENNSRLAKLILKKG